MTAAADRATRSGRRPWHRWPLALAVVAAPGLLGCELLYPGLGLDPGFDEEFETELLAAYRSGSATIEFADGAVIDLPDVARSSGLTAVYGSSVRWSNDEGWHLSLIGAGPDLDVSWAYVQIDRVVGGTHWTTADTSRCIITLERADESGVAGSATCRDLEWYDALDQPADFTEPSRVAEPPFDAELVFEARPPAARD